MVESTLTALLALQICIHAHHVVVETAPGEIGVSNRSAGQNGHLNKGNVDRVVEMGS